MKSIFTFIIGLLVCFNGTAFAAKPCEAIEKACKAAGFYKGGNVSGKGLYLNCLQPIIEGKTVPNVTVSEADIKTCQVKAKEKMQQQQATQV